MRVSWTPHARNRLSALTAYIRRGDPAAAQHVARTIRAQVGQLAVHPTRGRYGRAARTRELVIVGLPYIVPYTVTDTGVVILSVQHTSQRWPNAFDSRRGSVE